MTTPWDMARVASLRAQHKPKSRIGDLPTLGQIGHSRGLARRTKDHGACAACGFHVCTDACMRRCAAEASELAELERTRAAAIAYSHEQARKRAHFNRVIEAYPSDFTVIHHPAQQKGRVWVDHECKVIVFCVQDMPDDEIEKATENSARMLREAEARWRSDGTSH